MNYLAVSQEIITLIVLAVSIIPIILLMVYAIVVAMKRSKREGLKREEDISINLDETQKNLFIQVYGGQDNIKVVTIQMSRINVTVQDIDKVKVEELKELGAKGILLVDDSVKCSFGDRASYIYNLLQSRVQQ